LFRGFYEKITICDIEFELESCGSIGSKVSHSITRSLLRWFRNSSRQFLQCPPKSL